MDVTNEKLAKRFNNMFELVNYSIRIAEELLKSGRELRVGTDNQNTMYQVLLEISSGKDKAVTAEQLQEIRELAKQQSRERSQRGHDSHGS
jgi:DNA-directed RNA polymerase subunit omega